MNLWLDLVWTDLCDGTAKLLNVLRVSQILSLLNLSSFPQFLSPLNAIRENIGKYWVALCTKHRTLQSLVTLLAIAGTKLQCTITLLSYGFEPAAGGNFWGFGCALAAENTLKMHLETWFSPKTSSKSVKIFRLRRAKIRICQTNFVKLPNLISCQPTRPGLTN